MHKEEYLEMLLIITLSLVGRENSKSAVESRKCLHAAQFKAGIPFPPQAEHDMPSDLLGVLELLGMAPPSCTVRTQ